MKPLRWSPHALKSLTEREIGREEADATLAAPEFVTSGAPPRIIHMRRYFDRMLDQEMLLRIVIEETADERVVVTVYKTSQIGKYLKGLAP